MTAPTRPTYRIAIDVSDQEAGERGDPRRCPVSLAIRRKLGLKAEVTGAYIDLAGHGSYTASSAFADWLWQFDVGRAAVTVELVLDG